MHSAEFYKGLGLSELIKKKAEGKEKVMCVKISYIVPIFNTEKYIARCIESVLAQTYKNIELILVNDASTDKSLSICNEYALKDDRIIVHSLIENGGESNARNVGLSDASGDIICFVDSDDWIDKEHADYVISNMDDDVDIVYIGFDHKIERVTKEEYDNEEAVVKHLNLDKLGGYCWDKAYRASLIKNISFPVGINIGPDGVFSFRAILRARGVLYTNKPLYHYEIRDDSASERKLFTYNQFDVYKQCDLIKSELEDFPKYNKLFYCYEMTRLYTLLTKMLQYDVVDAYPSEYERLTREITSHADKACNFTNKISLKIKCIVMRQYISHPKLIGKAIVGMEKIRTAVKKR